MLRGSGFKGMDPQGAGFQVFGPSRLEQPSTTTDGHLHAEYRQGITCWGEVREPDLIVIHSTGDPMVKPPNPEP